MLSKKTFFIPLCNFHEEIFFINSIMIVNYKMGNNIINPFKKKGVYL